MIDVLIHNEWPISTVAIDPKCFVLDLDGFPPITMNANDPNILLSNCRMLSQGFPNTVVKPNFMLENGGLSY